MRKFIMMATAALALTATSTGAMAEDLIIGKWKAPGGGIVEVVSCGGDFCATVVSGEHKGKSVGKMSGQGTQYDGTVTDPRDSKTYEGSVEVQESGSILKMRGCALKIFCKTQTWTRI